MSKQKFSGVLTFHSETGTEGGYWAFHDRNYISKSMPRHGISEGRTVWDSENPNRKGITKKGAEVLRNGQWDPLPDPILDDPDYYESSLFRGERRGDREADKRLAEKYGFTIKYAADRLDERYGEDNWELEDPSTAVLSDGTRVSYGGTPITEPTRPYGLGELTRVTVEWEDGKVEQRLSDSLLVETRDYEGLHILRDGDYLKIYDRENSEEIIWEGEIDLIEFPVFSEHVFGLWIHAEQKGIDREEWAEWFFEKYPAELIKN